MLISVLAAAAALSLPAPVTGDFDHDGKADLAVIQPANGGYDLVVRLSAAGKAEARIASFKAADVANLYLGKAAPGVEATACGKGAGRADAPCPRKSVALTGDTLDFGTEEASRAVALWTGSKFEVVWLAD